MTGSVLGAEAFRAVLNRERAVAERATLSFAVLAFAAVRGPEASVEDRLIDTIRARLRATDVVGWLSAQDLGVLLRYASVADALRLAAEIRTSAEASSLACTAYGYPPFEFQLRTTAQARQHRPAATLAAELESAGTSDAPAVHGGLDGEVAEPSLLPSEAAQPAAPAVERAVAVSASS